jgi:hypothetical protein
VSGASELSVEERERVERGMLAIGAIRWPGRQLVIEWPDADPVGDSSACSSDLDRGVHAA